MIKKRNRKRIVGVVVSDKMDKTAVVEVNRLVQHPIYKKYIRRRSKFKAHDEENKVRIGDTVEIVQSRPLSKTKHWRVSKIISHQA
ncbi:MAG: 30S ribosomal protein S17 [Deltaproteobacteria bacterium]|nr:30S ribosomal protein S17 [Deltaproteobacteria bacterium]MBW2051731.1 30S ribosomal protein S17 [Deltaproteobacteria bacterium]MBW2140270.1 30S ribosomal protein S17 [Deltaproteobacteria bacterium]MBW2322113.1 30S ribosomal protein S17 [Deltaproteobacteria bacterium]